MLGIILFNVDGAAQGKPANWRICQSSNGHFRRSNSGDHFLFSVGFTIRGKITIEIALCLDQDEGYMLVPGIWMSNFSTPFEEVHDMVKQVASRNAVCIVFVM